MIFRRTLAAALLMCLGCQAATAQGLTKVGYKAEILDVLNADMPAPQLPDITAYTAEAIMGKVPAAAPGTASVLPMSDIPGVFQFMDASGFDIYRKMQGGVPRLIAIEEGVYTLSGLALALADEKILSCNPEKICHARLPIYVGRRAGLIVGDGETLNLETKKGAFMAGAGRFFFIHAKVQSWDSANNKTSPYLKDDAFRPFMTFWNGSEVYALNSTFIDLGYQGTQSYGFSFAANGDLGDMPKRNQWMIGNTFDGLMYGFYTYEASDVVLLRNIYRRNVYYGIDPHDRSENLIIGFNDVSDTKKRHGIILSREVNNSYVFNNTSYRNGGSGIMIDRSSKQNIMAYNTSHDNEREGIYIAESSDILSYKNKSMNNRKSGLRIRNASDVISYQDELEGNGEQGLYAYAVGLEHLQRDFTRDPYSKRLDFAVIGTSFRRNVKGVLKVRDADHILLNGLSYDSGGELGVLTADLGFFAGAIQGPMQEKAKAVEMTNFRHIDEKGALKKSFFKTACEILQCP
jgi:poly(beta-D-mannuronate) C5 epimerase